MAKTYLTRDNKWVSNKPDSYWSGLVDYYTGEKIYTWELFVTENARGHSKPVILTCTDYIASQAHTWLYREYFIIRKYEEDK